MTCTLAPKHCYSHKPGNALPSLYFPPQQGLTFIESEGSRRCMFIRSGFVHCADVKQAEKRVRSTQRAPIRVRTSMKGDAHTFPVTIDAFVGAYFLPTVRRRRHNDSHFM